VDKLETWVQLKKQIKSWLKCGILTSQGSIETQGQGGVISPLLANIALHGMEQHLNKWVTQEPIRSPRGKMYSYAAKQSSLGFIPYADDFVVLHKDRKVVEGAKIQIENWLAHMGLKLKDSKTRLAHSDPGKSDLPF